MSKNDRSKIAILLPDLRGGGAERLHIHLAAEWLNRGIDVEFVLQVARGELMALLPSGARAIDLQVTRVRYLLWPLLWYLRSSRPDVLLAATWPLTLVAPLAGSLSHFGGRIIISEHNVLSIQYAKRRGLKRWLQKKCMHVGYQLAHARIAVSKGVARDVASLSGLNQSWFEVIYNPAATGQVTCDCPRPPELYDATGPILLSVGSLKKQKRFDLLIDAFERLKQESSAKLYILGEGPERQKLESQIAELGLSDRVLLPGFVRDTAPWYANADLFVLSSDYEGFGNVIVEAMEQGLPVVCTDCPFGPNEILEDGKYGRLVPTGDPEALAVAIMDSLKGDHDRRQGQLRAKDFLVSNISSKYLSVIFPQNHGMPAQ